MSYKDGWDRLDHLLACLWKGSTLEARSRFTLKAITYSHFNFDSGTVIIQLRKNSHSKPISRFVGCPYIMTGTYGLLVYTVCVCSRMRTCTCLHPESVYPRPTFYPKLHPSFYFAFWHGVSLSCWLALTTICTPCRHWTYNRPAPPFQMNYTF